MAKTDYKALIPAKFYSGDNHPRAKTVGALIKILQQLPANFRLENSDAFQTGMEVIVYNISQADRFVALREVE